MGVTVEGSSTFCLRERKRTSIFDLVFLIVGCSIVEFVAKRCLRTGQGGCEGVFERGAGGRGGDGSGDRDDKEINGEGIEWRGDDEG